MLASSGVRGLYFQPAFSIDLPITLHWVRRVGCWPPLVCATSTSSLHHLVTSPLSSVVLGDQMLPPLL
jgi:hypothetical protein